jgi:hypothetical protein
MRLAPRSTSAILLALAAALAAAPAHAGGKTSQPDRAGQVARSTARPRGLARVIEEGAGLNRTRVAVKGTMHQVQTDIPVTGHLTFEPGTSSPIMRLTLQDDAGHYAPLKLVVPLTTSGSYFKAYGSTPASRTFGFSTPATLGHPGWNRNGVGHIRLSTKGIELDYEIASYGPNMAYRIGLKPL